VLNAKPRLSSFSRLLLCQRVLAGRPVAHVAKEMGISRATAYKWLRRFRECRRRLNIEQSATAES
jgi:transposase